MLPDSWDCRACGSGTEANGAVVSGGEAGPGKPFDDRIGVPQGRWEKIGQILPVMPRMASKQCSDSDQIWKLFVTVKPEG